RAEGLGDIPVAPRRARLGLVAGERIGGDRDDRRPRQFRDGADPAGRLVAVDLRQLYVHEDQIWPFLLRHRHACSAVPAFDPLVADSRQQVANDLAVVFGVLDDQDALAHSAASIISSTWTGRTTRKVEPWPSTDSTAIVPPCISTMRLEIARPSPVPPLLRV